MHKIRSWRLVGRDKNRVAVKRKSKANFTDIMEYLFHNT